MARECQDKNAKGLAMVAVGVNKAAEQYLILDERTREELASGRRASKPRPAGWLRVTEGGRPHLRAGRLLAVQSLLPLLS